VIVRFDDGPIVACWSMSAELHAVAS